MDFLCWNEVWINCCNGNRCWFFVCNVVGVNMVLSWEGWQCMRDDSRKQVFGADHIIQCHLRAVDCSRNKLHSLAAAVRRKLSVECVCGVPGQRELPPLALLPKFSDLTKTDSCALPSYLSLCSAFMCQQQRSCKNAKPDWGDIAELLQAWFWYQARKIGDLVCPAGWWLVVTCVTSAKCGSWDHWDWIILTMDG